MDAVGQYWVANLANYNFWLHYKPGKSNVEADALSRIGWDSDMSDNVSLDNLAVKVIIENKPMKLPFFKVYVGYAVTARSFHAITIRTVLIDSENSLISQKRVKVPVQMSKEQWVEEQDRDSHITEIQKFIKQNKIHQWKKVRRNL